MPVQTKKAVVEKDYCVACGCCVKVCPLGAIQIDRGRWAVVSERCVGCGRCANACPASVISVEVQP